MDFGMKLLHSTPIYSPGASLTAVAMYPGLSKIYIMFITNMTALPVKGSKTAGGAYGAGFQVDLGVEVLIRTCSQTDLPALRCAAASLACTVDMPKQLQPDRPKRTSDIAFLRTHAFRLSRSGTSFLP